MIRFVLQKRSLGAKVLKVLVSNSSFYKEYFNFSTMSEYGHFCQGGFLHLVPRQSAAGWCLKVSLASYNPMSVWENPE